MSSIELKYAEIQKEMSVDNEGKITFTMRGGSRLVGVARNSLFNCFTSGQETGHRLTKSLINSGFDVASFSRTGIPDLAMAIIASYYAFDAGVYCTEDAKLFCQAFIAIGIRSWGQKLLGWKSSEEEFRTQVLTSLAILTKEVQELKPLRDEVLALRPAVEEFKRIIPALEALPELKPLLEQISKELKNNPSQRSEKLSVWLNELGIKLPLGKRKSLGRIISDFLKVGSLESPEKKGCNFYPEAMLPLIELGSRYIN